ncbi:MAG: Rne/Rng family ribonuclease [Planctomycetota bacterium]|nr:MAG: Rne/Rng family ribonuclease [Planctomycetota bacterium]
MTRRMLINVVEPEESRIAILKNNTLDELYIENTSKAKYQGNIYKGKIINIEPSIQACFVDFGEATNGFLHLSDTVESWQREEKNGGGKRNKKIYIQDLFTKGQEILVQVTKEGINGKAPSLTTCISLPGRFLVFMPFLHRLGVSKKIQKEEERNRLKQILQELPVPKGMGVIARTAAEGQPKKQIEKDFNYLLKLFNLVKKRAKKEHGPKLLYQESDLVIKTIRDVLSQDIKEIIIDEPVVYKKVKDFLQLIMPRHKRKVRLYNKAEPLFHAFQIEKEIEKIYQRKVILPSGGNIVIDQTEAMVTIDVNSSRSKKEKNLEETAFRTNYEAAIEICRQLRLRDLGGLVVCDFIDMVDDRHKREIERVFRENLKKDRAKTTMAKMSRFCIIELSRQRLRPSLSSSIYMTCPHCKGSGYVKTIDSLCVNIIRQIKLHLSKNDMERVSLRLNPVLASYIQNTKRGTLWKLEKKYHKSILIESDMGFGMEEFEFQRL